MNHIENFIKEISPKLTTWRRALHQKPELGFTEYVTTYLIGKELLKLGFTIYVGKEALESSERMGVPASDYLELQEERARTEGVEDQWLEKMKDGHTGLVATLDTGKPGPHMAFRVDIDALPITESNDKGHSPYQHEFQSKHDGVMHACGHDGHTSIGLGVATYLSQFQNQLKGKFTLLFQPAEEGGRGAKAMVKKGWLDGVDYFVSGHIGIRDTKLGMIAATTDSFLASSKLNVIYKGKAAHAGLEPEKGKNALLAAAAASLHLYNIPRHSDGETRINVGKLQAGTGRNIIADEAYLEVETRGQTTKINHYMLEEAKRILQSAGGLYNVATRIETVGETIEAACNSEWIHWIKEISSESPLITDVSSSMSLKASEDVTYMINEVQKQGGKATYMVFGTSLKNGHHHSRFDFEEGVLEVAVDAFIRLISKLSRH
ncbi:aminobenzoyl-glutamate utilization protein A [Bacillus pakistanensis]|uniref:Aminobenzoyl-glutamate utilization protein A n=1 Tax=Rossellomorea pakistanensis TaxID=992288 RepID=A0ABS2NCZ4_9BACI|nr:amidohydrolase [Bacillus pakistanensis]MBM7585732.1 aminobenzoyl-glutamate utilization protein A [Bacillus pakistanensis]